MTTDILSPSSKNFLSMHGGKKEEEESDDEPDALLTWLERNPSEDSLRSVLMKCFEDESAVCSTLKLAQKTSMVSHPREFNEDAWNGLNSLAATAKAKNAVICKVLATCVENVETLLSLDFLNVLEVVDGFLDSIRDDFPLRNDSDEPLPDFNFSEILEQASLIDEAKSSHSVQKSIKIVYA